MLPPSRTTRRPWRCGRQRRRFSFLFALATTAASFLWFEYLAQPLNRKWLIATSRNCFERKSDRSPASSRDRWARRRTPPYQGWHPTSSRWNAPVLASRDSQPARRRARLSTDGAQFPRRPRESERIFPANRLVRAASRAR